MTMSEKDQPIDSKRRDFLRGSVAAATGIAATTAAVNRYHPDESQQGQNHFHQYLIFL